MPCWVRGVVHLAQNLVSNNDRSDCFTGRAMNQISLESFIPYSAPTLALTIIGLEMPEEAPTTILFNSYQ